MNSPDHIDTGCAAECDKLSECGAFDFRTEASASSCRLVTGDADPREGGGDNNRQYCTGSGFALHIFVLANFPALELLTHFIICIFLFTVCSSACLCQRIGHVAYVFRNILEGYGRNVVGLH